MKPTLEQRLAILERAVLPPPTAARSLKQIKTLEPARYAIVIRCMVAVCAKAELPVEAMRVRGRTRYLAHWRQVAMFLSFELSGLGSQDVATIFNRKDHATVLHAHKMIPHRAPGCVLKQLREQVSLQQNAA